MTKKLLASTNQYLADIGVSYIKLHNLHWNVTGSQFKAVHEYLESLYDAYADVLDEVAEIIKMEEELPLASMKEYLEVATIQEISSAEICTRDTLHILLSDMELLKREAENLRALAGEEDNYLLVNSLEDQLANYAKNIWFLRAMKKRFNQNETCPI